MTLTEDLVSQRLQDRKPGGNRLRVNAIRILDLKIQQKTAGGRTCLAEVLDVKGGGGGNI